MEKARTFLTKEQAFKICYFKGNQIHNFIISSFGLIGADWNDDEFKECLETADTIEIGGDNIRNMGHALAIIKGKKVYFFEHNEEKLLELETKEVEE